MGLGAELVCVTCYMDARNLPRFDKGFHYKVLYRLIAEAKMNERSRPWRPLIIVSDKKKKQGGWVLFVAHPQGRKKKENNFGVGSLVFIKGGSATTCVYPATYH